MEFTSTLAVVTFGVAQMIKGLCLCALLALGSGIVADSAVAAGPSLNSQPRLLGEVPVTAMNLQAKPVNNSPAIAVDPTDRRFAVIANRLDGPAFNCALQASGDAGRSWLPAYPVPNLPKGAERCYAPEAGFDKSGRLYYLFVGLHGQGNTPMGVFLTSSTDRARSFSSPRKILGPNSFQVRMAIDASLGRKGRIHVVWLRANGDPGIGALPPGPNPIMSMFSDDGGVKFSKPVQVSDADRERPIAPALALGPHGSVHVVYYDLKDDSRDYLGLEGPAWEGNWELVSASSADNGRHFGKGVVVDSDVIPPERVMLIFTMPPPSLAAGPDGTLYASWDDARNGDWDVFMRRSTDGGKTWGSPVRINDDPLHDGRHQYLPKVSVAPNGRVDAIFYDRRGEQTDNRSTNVYYAYSLDRGATFSANRKLTDWDFDPQIGPSYQVQSAKGLQEFGSRIGLFSEGASVIAAWTDTRNNGRGVPAQDIFSRRVLFPASSGKDKNG